MPSHSRKKHKRFAFEQKLIIFLLVFVVALSAVLIVLLIDNNSLRDKLNEAKNSSVNSPISSEASQVQNSSGISSSNTSSESTVDLPDPDDWNLRLANSQNVLPEGFTVETALITPAYARDKGMSFDARAVGDLNRMLAAANEDGVNLLVISCFRTMNKQTNLYNAEVQKWLNQGYNEADAKTKAATIVAVPGTSDHNLGLAVDLNSVEESFENTRQFTWLQEHAEEYGFVMRYPKHKQDITKIIYEPWHYRYVGVEAAKEMNEKDMCLEEYVEYLRGLGR